VSSTLSSPHAGRIGQVTLGVTHTYDSDLSFTLTSPGGQTLALITRRGGSGDNFTGTVLDDAAATPISAGTAPFTGSFRPEQPLSTFTGSSVGTWTLRVWDSFSGDVGTLTSWGIKLRSCAPAPVGVAVNNAPAINEGTGTGTTAMTFTVFRSGPTTNAITFPVSTQNGTAVAPGDYTAISGQTVTIGAGVAQKTVTVQVKKDATVEPNETLKLAIGTVPAGVQKVRGTGVGTIKNDD
jgi:subtilisin-like proprotein convertase family protein